MARVDETLNDWLRDAHAMEEQAEQMLSAQASRLEHYPELRARIQRHIEETRSQSERIAACLDRRGASSSAIKDMTGRMTAMAQGLGGMFAGDELVKGAMAGYTFEHLEMATYRSLIAGAEAAGDRQTADVCRAILAEEEAMADWLFDHLDPTVATYLGREATPGATAKR